MQPNEARERSSTGFHQASTTDEANKWSCPAAHQTRIAVARGIDYSTTPTPFATHVPRPEPLESARLKMVRRGALSQCGVRAICPGPSGEAACLPPLR